MSSHTFRPSIARVQNAQKIFTSTKTNATIRDLEEEEGELEEKEGTVVSIKRDLINGAGWTVKDNEGQLYTCSCATSMYEVPESIERGGILYPTDTVEVVFTINPVLRINTIKEIKSLGSETEKIDISKWTHGDEATTVIAKPKSAVSISDGFIKLDYNNDNKLIADGDGIKTQGNHTIIDTDKLSINSNDITINEDTLENFIEDNALQISNDFATYSLESPNNNTIDTTLMLDRTNNITQLDIKSNNFVGYGVIGHIKDQKSIPIRIQSQQLLTDGNCVDIITIDEDGIIYVDSFEDSCPQPQRKIQSLTQWITPQVEARNYLKVTVHKTCDYCDEWDNIEAEYINYCPTCQEWNCLVDTSTSVIKCTKCNTKYCENCGTSLSNNNKLKKYKDNYIIGYGTTCTHCENQLKKNTTKYYVNYCPNCNKWHTLSSQEYQQNNNMINVLICSSCNSVFCCTCGIDQNNYGLTITDAPVQYTSYKNALRKLKYIKG